MYVKQVRGAIRDPQTSMVLILTKIVSNINSKTLTILEKRLILVTGLGPGRASTNGYITVLNVQMEICKDGRRVKIDQLN